MADHYLKSLELLDEIDDLAEALDREYAGAARPHIIGKIHTRIGQLLKLSHTHAELATGQAVRDLASTVDGRRGVTL